MSWLVTDRPVGLAVPDLTGGVLFQYVDPARPEWSWDAATARWQMSWPAGGPESILRQEIPGGPISTTVPADGVRLWLLDTGTIDGTPALAYGRLVGGDERIPPGFPQCEEIDRCGEIGWRVELVVRAVDGGPERVVHEELWRPGITETARYTARLGEDLISLVATPYPGGGEYSSRSLTFIDPDGGVILGDGRPDPSCRWCDLTADLPPVGDSLAYVERSYEEWSENETGPAEVVLVSTTTGDEHWRVALPGDAHTIDTDGTRSVVTVDGSCDPSEPPILALGEQGPWVARLQRQLNRLIAAGLEVDATFGPATEAAVRDWQALIGDVPTGSTEPATWGGLLPDRSCTAQLLFVAGERVTPIELSIGWGRDDPASLRGAPRRGVALVPGEFEVPAAGPRSVEELELRPDGIGPHEFGTERSEVEAWITSVLGPPEVSEVADAQVYVCARWGCGESHVLRWPSGGLSVAFVDRADTGNQLPETALAAWTVSADEWWPGRIFPLGISPVDRSVRAQLTTDEGVGLGSTVAEVEASLPSVAFLGWNDGSFQPTGFYVTDSTGGVTLEGDLDWNPVVGMQSALNERGAELPVDGVVGPATRAALADFQEQHDTAAPEATFEALGLTRPSPDAHVVRLSAGGWFWEFECGEMAIFGFEAGC